MIDTHTCSDCGVESPRSEWRHGELPCEDDGGHNAIICPACGEGEYGGFIEDYFVGGIVPQNLLAKDRSTA